VLKLFNAVINKVGVFVNEDDYINSWWRKWTSHCIHRQSRCGKNSFGWSTGSWNGQYCFGEQWQPGVDIFLWFPPSQNIIVCIRQASIQLNFSITCVFKMDMFRQQSFLPCSMELETGQTYRWMLPHSFRLNYYSPAVTVHLNVYLLPETVSEKLLCFGRLRNLERRSSYAGMDQSNAPIMFDSVTSRLRLRACRMRCFIDITMAQSVGRSWRAATISTLNSKTRLIVGYLEPQSTWDAVLKKSSRTQPHAQSFSILRRYTFYQTIEGVQSTAQQVAE